MQIKKDVAPSKADFFKKTLLLPQTDFNMRARLAETEPQIIQKWERMKIHERMLEKRAKSPLYFLLDGPPYANGPVHLGHVVNKVLKDIVVKFQNMNGRRAPFQPVWDCHGLPIETAVLQKTAANENPPPLPSNKESPPSSSFNSGTESGLRRAGSQAKGAAIPGKREGGTVSWGQNSFSKKEIRALCRKEALFWMKKQRAGFQRLGIAALWDDPVLTMDGAYEAEELRVLAAAAERGLLYRGEKPVFWCFKLRTALAFSEAEYEERTDPSVYISFDLTEESCKKLAARARSAPSPDETSGVEGKKAALAIWTTTPWTLPANSAVALHPDLDYGLYEEGKDRRLLIAAAGRKEAFEKESGLSLSAPKAVFKGKDLEGLECLHPFIERKSPIVTADYVTLSSGTGCVHTAPGHGPDDWKTGRKYHLPAFCPVDERGCFTDEAPEDLRGVFIFKGNKIIIDRLQKAGRLLHETKIKHSCPKSPRSNSPLIYRLTPQWFLRIGDEHEDAAPAGKAGGPAVSGPAAGELAAGAGGRISFFKKFLKIIAGVGKNPSLVSAQKKPSLRALSLKAAEDQIRFIPQWGKARMESMLKRTPDWCLSRQRAWGVPLPVFYCKACGAPFLDPKTIRRIADEMERSGLGIDYYFETAEEELLSKKNAKCASCGKRDFQKGEDILDVWFDSGIASRFFQKKYSLPADLFLEGSDQHRGWFQTSLFSSLAADQTVPFKTLVTHGFVTDSQGRKMSKSLGNGIDPEEVFKESGAEILRLWAAAEDFSKDMATSKESFRRTKEVYRRFRNTFRFFLGNLNGFSFAEEAVPFDKLFAVDKQALIQLNRLIAAGRKDYENFAFHKVFHALNHFFTVNLSSFYLDIIKDRLYTFHARSLERRAARTVLFYMTQKLLPFTAPIASFLAEEVYSYFAEFSPGRKDSPSPGRKEESVFLEDFPQAEPSWEDPKTEALFERLFPLRERLFQELEAMRAEGRIGSGLEGAAILSLNKPLPLSQRELCEFFGVSSVALNEGAESARAAVAEGAKCLRCWFVSPSLNKDQICKKCLANMES